MPQADSQSPGVFICYRRDDTAGHAGRLYDRLSAHFADGQIFMDLERIEPGEDFVKKIEEAVGSCEILLALIGRGWLTSQDETGRRLDNPNDFVRVEIAAAFARDVRVIPVLVQNARMPRQDDLPEVLRPIARRQAFDLSDQRWKQDVNRLVSTLERILAQQREALQHAAEEEEERQRREAEARQQAEAAEAEAQRQAEENERLRRAAEEQAAEAERRKREAEEAERGRRETEERERLAAEQAAPPADEAVEPLKEMTAAHEPSAIETPSAPAPASSSGSGHALTPATATPLMSKGERAALVGVIVCVIVFTAAWAFTRWKAGGTQVNANQNATPPGTPQAAQKETPSPPSATPQPPAGMVFVPGGKFMMGSDDGDEYERPAHEVSVNPFFIDQYEVTNEEYAAFIRETKRQPPRVWARGTYPDDAHRPVTGVTWDGAVAYARWVGKRLPTEEEWEFAARGTDGRRYPWGNDWRPGLANAASNGVANVGSYPEGKSPFGVFDMAGNAWEWTASELIPYPGAHWKPQAPNLRVIRGGSHLSNQRQVTTTYRRGWPVRGGPGYSETGFRCASN